ncbi:hypothetical protein [Nesterenkonia sp. CF4.4]
MAGENRLNLTPLALDPRGSAHKVGFDVVDSDQRQRRGVEIRGF